MIQGPLVSVIMPLYNKRPYAGHSVRSILEQTYRSWELIVMDDGSTDRSADAVPLNDRRIRLFRQENKGPGAARNAAVKKGEGEYIAFIDADDFYYPFKLESEMDLLWKEQKAEWMMSAWDYHTGGTTEHHYVKDVKNADIRDETDVFDDALGQLNVAGWPSNGLFMKRTLFERLGGFNEEMRYGEITEFILRCAVMQPRIVICHRPLHLHISVPGSTAKIPVHKKEYPRQIGESLFKLAQSCPQHAFRLRQRGRDSMLSYAASQILVRNGREARKFLVEDFQFEKGRKWWKMWLGSWLPVRIVRRLLKTQADQ